MCYRCFTNFGSIVLVLLHTFTILFSWFRRQFLGSSSYNWLCQCYRRWGSNCWIKTEPISLQGESGDIETIKWERHAKTQTYWSPNCEKNTEKPLDKFGGFVGSETVPCFVHHVVFVPIELEIWIPLAPSLSRNILNI